MRPRPKRACSRPRTGRSTSPSGSAATASWPPAPPATDPRRPVAAGVRRYGRDSPRVHEVDHVAVLDDVLLALGAQQRLLAGGVERTQLDDVVYVVHLGAHEPVLDVAVDATRGLLGRPAAGRIHSDIEHGFVRAQVVN